jgi:putative Ca2+/H+ antiporter (TMEM165/GDT1 family)
MLSVVWSLIVAAASACGLVFVAELGDKTQLLALGFGARHGLRTVAGGLALGYAAAGAVAAVVGGLLGASLPERPIAIGAGVLFVVGAGLMLADRDGTRADGADTTGRSRPPTRRISVVASIGLTVALGEMGDKTQLATMALAARSNLVATWFGATAGAFAAGLIGAIAGRRLGRRIDPGLLAVGSAGLFGVFGVTLIVTAW